MRIAVSAPIVEPHPTGVGVYSINLVNELARICDDLLVYTSYPSGFEIDLVKTRSVSELTRPARGVSGFWARMTWMQSALPLRTLLDRVSVTLSTGTEGTFFPFVPQVITVHDLIPLLFPNLYPRGTEPVYFKHLLPAALRSCRAVIAVSESTKRDIISCYGLPPERIHVTYEGFDKEQFYPRQETEAVTASYGLKHYIHYGGNILPHKNVQRLVRAFKRIALEVPHMLVLQGRHDSEYAESVKDLIKELNLEARVLLVGYVPYDHLPYLYSAATAYVNVSLCEGFGLPPLEAMACGTPVIAADAASLPEVVGDAGILVDPRDVEQIAEALLKVTKYPEERTRLSEKAIKRAALFSWAKTAEETLKVLRIAAGQAITDW